MYEPEYEEKKKFSEAVENALMNILGIVFPILVLVKALIVDISWILVFSPYIIIFSTIIGLFFIGVIIDLAMSIGELLGSKKR